MEVILKYTLISVIFAITLCITLNQLFKLFNLIVKSLYTCNLITYTRLRSEVKKIRTRFQDLCCKLLSL